MRYLAYWSSIILCVFVLFPSQTLIFSLGSAIGSLVTKLMTAMTISKECLFIFRESFIFLLVMAIFIFISSQKLYLGRILMTGFSLPIILLLLGCIFLIDMKLFICFAIQGFMSKFITRVSMTKKELLISTCHWYSRHHICSF